MASEALRELPSEAAAPAARPRLLTFSILFPHPGAPRAGLFIRERAFRLGRVLPLLVVSPQPWFPGQGLLRRWRPHFRPPAPRREVQAGFEVLHPPFLCPPGVLKGWDGDLLAASLLPWMRRLAHRFDVIDAHFAYPDGYAAVRLGRALGKPVTITLRGTEVPHSRHPVKRRKLLQALEGAARVFAVAEALKAHVVSLGADPAKIQVVPNGVDTERFRPEDRRQARRRLGLPEGGRWLITVGGLVPRKGFHRVIELLPQLPGDVGYLVVGGASAEGDHEAALRRLAEERGVAHRVRFLGPWDPDELRWPLSAADVFVLASSNEGWANVLLEAMACGLPVVATDVGGNREVVCRPGLGTVVPFGDQEALRRALAEALERRWDRAALRAHAEANRWEARIATLARALEEVATGAR